LRRRLRPQPQPHLGRLHRLLHHRHRLERRSRASVTRLRLGSVTDGGTATRTCR
jgi:hypothetical protein